MTNNQINYWNYRETGRSNRAKESETKRHNLATEDIQRDSNAINRSKVSNDYTLGLGNLEINKGKLEEEKRSHQAQEYELNRSHMANEELTHMANLINARNAATNEYNAGTNRMNAVTNARQLLEIGRSNLAQESLKQAQIDESIRHAQAEEANNKLNILTSYSNKLAGNSNVRVQNQIQQQNANTNYLNYVETKRNNLIDQQLNALRLRHTIENDSAQQKSNLLSNLTRSLRFSYNGGSK